MSTKEREQLYAEFSILGSLRHPNIVAYYHREHLKASQDLFIYMEYCGGGDLSRVIQTLKDNNKLADEEFVWTIFSQLVSALYRCHYGKDPPEVGRHIMATVNAPKVNVLKSKAVSPVILHRDLKPENGKPKILISKGLIDRSSFPRRRPICQTWRLWSFQADDLE